MSEWIPNEYEGCDQDYLTDELRQALEVYNPEDIELWYFPFEDKRECHSNLLKRRILGMVGFNQVDLTWQKDCQGNITYWRIRPGALTIREIIEQEWANIDNIGIF